MIRKRVAKRLQRVANGLSSRIQNHRNLARLRQTSHPLAVPVADAIVSWQKRAPLGDHPAEDIEREREKLRLDETPLSDIAPGFNTYYTVGRACRGSMKPLWAPLLAHLVSQLRPTTTLELGTNLGISSSYMAGACRHLGGKVVTMEGSPGRQAVAKSLHESLRLNNIHYHLGKFQDELPQVLEQYRPISLAFIDGHHRYEPTLEYFDTIYPATRHPAAFVFDDIALSDGMIRAWGELCQDSRFAVVLSTKKIGIALTKKNPDKVKPQVLSIPKQPA